MALIDTALIICMFYLKVSFSYEKRNIQWHPRSSTTNDFILCRNCGTDISSSNYIISKLSPSSLFAYNETLFNKENVLVQVLTDEVIFHIFHFSVITVVHSHCIGVGEWEEDKVWFPGYRGRFCICPDCGTYVGWVFEPINSLSPKSKPFYCLILSTLISESCKYILNFFNEWVCKREFVFILCYFVLVFMFIIFIKISKTLIHIITCFVYLFIFHSIFLETTWEPALVNVFIF